MLEFINPLVIVILVGGILYLSVQLEKSQSEVARLTNIMISYNTYMDDEEGSMINAVTERELEFDQRIADIKESLNEESAEILHPGLYDLSQVELKKLNEQIARNDSEEFAK